jgi:hypothetical protein
MPCVFLYNDIVWIVNRTVLRWTLCKSVQAPFYFGTGEGTHRSINNPPVLVKEECGNPLHAMNRRGLRGAVDVYFRKLTFPV